MNKQTPEICLAAIKRDGWALIFVHNQTPEICLAAVNQNGGALKHVHNQTPEICLAAVKQDSYALRYVEERIFDEIEKKDSKTLIIDGKEVSEETVVLALRNYFK